MRLNPFYDALFDKESILIWYPFDSFQAVIEGKEFYFFPKIRIKVSHKFHFYYLALQFPCFLKIPEESGVELFHFERTCDQAMKDFNNVFWSFYMMEFREYVGSLVRLKLGL